MAIERAARTDEYSLFFSMVARSCSRVRRRVMGPTNQRRYLSSKARNREPNLTCGRCQGGQRTFENEKFEK
jgi:hypothetical protein